MENILWDNVVFKQRKTRQKLALSLTPLGAVRVAAKGTGYKNRRLEKSHGVRFDYRLVQSVRCDTLWAWKGSLSLPTLSSDCLWEHSRCLSSACIAVGAVAVTPAENFVSPLTESSGLLLRIRIKKKVSVAARQSVHPSERSPTLPSSSGLCVQQIENEQQSTVSEVSQPLKVMALASRLAGPDNAVPSLPGSDSWLSLKKPKENPELVSARLGAVKLLFRCCRKILDLVVNKHASRSLLGSSRAFDFVWLCHLLDLLTITVRTWQASGMTCDSDVTEKPSRCWRALKLVDFVWES